MKGVGEVAKKSRKNNGVICFGLSSEGARPKAVSFAQVVYKKHTAKTSPLKNTKLKAKAIKDWIT